MKTSDSHRVWFSLEGKGTFILLSYRGPHAQTLGTGPDQDRSHKSIETFHKLFTTGHRTGQNPKSKESRGLLGYFEI